MVYVEKIINNNIFVYLLLNPILEYILLYYENILN